MGNLYLVRHGQASFGATDYDNLSAIGVRQSALLGSYFKHKGISFEAVLTGRLRRHAQTWEALAKEALFEHQPQVWAGLDEYDSEAVVRAIHPDPLERPDTPERYRHHFRLLRGGLTQWMLGATRPSGMAPYPDFVQGIVDALDHVRTTYAGDVLIVSSGGPISTAVGHLLGTSPEATIELNFRIRNTSVTQFVFNPKRHMLLSYNNLPHLDGSANAMLETYA